MPSSTSTPLATPADRPGQRIDDRFLVSTAGYSGRPLVDKLGIEAGMRCAVLDPPENYRELLTGLPEGVVWEDADEPDLAFVHVFARAREGLEERLRTLRERIVRHGMIWVSWPKKASRVATDLSEDVVREAALSAGLVDVKVCAVDETWSGLKLVIRKADR